MTPLSIHDQIQKFRSIDKSIKKKKPHRYMEMSEEGNEEQQRMVTSPWTFIFQTQMLVSMPSASTRCNLLFFLFQQQHGY
jgi:hypothetical protein